MGSTWFKYALLLTLGLLLVSCQKPDKKPEKPEQFEREQISRQSSNRESISQSNSQRERISRINGDNGGNAELIERQQSNQEKINRESNDQQQIDRISGGGKNREIIDSQRSNREQLERANSESERIDRINNGGKNREIIDRERNDREQTDRQNNEREKIDRISNGGKNREQIDREKNDREQTDRQNNEREQIDRNSNGGKNREQIIRERNDREQLDRERNDREKIDRINNGGRNREIIDRETNDREQTDRQNNDRERIDRISNGGRNREQIDRERNDREQLDRERNDRERIDRDRLIGDGDRLICPRECQLRFNRRLPLCRFCNRNNFLENDIVLECAKKVVWLRDDNCDKIAGRFGLKALELELLNNFHLRCNADPLEYVGHQICVKRLKEGDTPKVSICESFHVALKGEKCNDLAKRYSTPLLDIVILNPDVDCDKLIEGEILCAKTFVAPKCEVFHPVTVSSETCQSIAAQHNFKDLITLMTFNTHLDCSKPMIVGQLICVQLAFD